MSPGRAQILLPVIARLDRAIQYPSALWNEQNRSYWVYILASDVGGTLYVGVTNDLVRRVYEHRTDAINGFSQKICRSPIGLL